MTAARRTTRSAGRWRSARPSPSRRRSSRSIKLRHLRRARHPARRRARHRRGLYRRFVAEGMSEGRRVHQLGRERSPGPISKTISHARHPRRATIARRRRQGDEFERAYSAAYHPAYEMLLEIYDEVSSGNEIRSVVMAEQRFSRYPMGKIDGTQMWTVGEGVRAPARRVPRRRSTRSPPASTSPR